MGKTVKYGLIAINAVALTRLQNGETEHLTSVAYLT